MTHMPSATGGSGIPSDSPEPMLAEQPGWPKGLGIFSIVWGSLGIVCGGCAAIGAFSGPAFYEWGRKQQMQAGKPDPGAMPDVFKATPLDLVGSLVWIVGAVVLLIAGITLVRRAAAGRSMHLVYGIVSIIGSLMGVAAAFMKQGGIATWVAANPGDPFLKQPGATLGGSLGFVLSAAGLSMIYPAFILVWFGVIKRRPEDMGLRVEEPIV